MIYVFQRTMLYVKSKFHRIASVLLAR